MVQHYFVTLADNQYTSSSKNHKRYYGAGICSMDACLLVAWNSMIVIKLALNAWIGTRVVYALYIILVTKQVAQVFGVLSSLPIL